MQEAINKTPSLNKKDNFSCKFKYTKLYCKFISTTLSYCIIDECDINECFFSVSEIISIIIARSQMKKVEFQDVDLSGAKFIDNYIEDLEFSDKVKSKLDTKTFFDKINPIKKTKEEYEGIYKVYEEIANVFSENMLKNNFGEYYYLAQNSKRKSLNGVTRIKSYIAWFVFGYGERIVFPIITSAIIILVFSILYLIVGIDVEGEIVSIIFQKYPKNFMELGSAFNESLNLSVGMFAGVGINKSMPLTSSYFLSDMEMIIGIIMMGIGIGSITRKIIR